MAARGRRQRAYVKANGARRERKRGKGEGLATAGEGGGEQTQARDIQRCSEAGAKAAEMHI